ncbi:hypothetical protein SDC9_135227 [bioreactor metagenome]|uniref:Uncharacterized protein n=1 Tax=bioreactor metagenome TaxID=1076179 RepID=A0A645DFK3_9ZZZZ
MRTGVSQMALYLRRVRLKYQLDRIGLCKMVFATIIFVKRGLAAVAGIVAFKHHRVNRLKGRYTRFIAKSAVHHAAHQQADTQCDRNGRGQRVGNGTHGSG